jgi:hypothetical protein
VTPHQLFEGRLIPGARLRNEDGVVVTLLRLSHGSR